jgi:YegS/Rv2252/BmrU family lipid kinase
MWFVVPKSKKAPNAARRAIKKGARLILVWGGDGMVQRTIDVVARTNAKRGKSKQVSLAIVPAGTANLLATHLGIPKDIAKAVEIAVTGDRQRFDVGTLNGERFAVMAGTGFDARIMGSVSSEEKARLGRLAYFRGTVKAMQAKSVRMRIRVDGTRWFKGKASCVLFGNIGTATGGLPVFPDASPQDGVLDVGVVTAKSAWEWMRVFTRTATGQPERSPFVQMTRAKKVVVKMNRRSAYELDGGTRPPVRRLQARIRPGALAICVPRTAEEQTKSPPLTNVRAGGDRFQLT